MVKKLTKIKRYSIILVVLVLTMAAVKLHLFLRHEGVTKHNILLTISTNVTNLPIINGSMHEKKNNAWERSQATLLHLKKFCDFMNLTSSQLSNYTQKHIHVDERHKAIYCYIPKVACTSWKRIWMKITNLIPKNANISSISRYEVHSSLSKLSDKIYAGKQTQILLSYKKFFLVRHPFERVLSAYKDKFESEYTKASFDFHESIGIMIEKKYRKSNNTNGHNVTFEEFINFISEPNYDTLGQSNEHWRSALDICSPCSINYDFMGRFENLIEDSDFILSWLGVTDIIDKFPAADRPFYAKGYDPDYFNKLGNKTKLKFFRKYLPDYVALQYDIM